MAICISRKFFGNVCHEPKKEAPKAAPASMPRPKSNDQPRAGGAFDEVLNDRNPDATQEGPDGRSAEQAPFEACRPMARPPARAKRLRLCRAAERGRCGLLPRRRANATRGRCNGGAMARSPPAHANPKTLRRRARVMQCKLAAQSMHATRVGERLSVSHKVAFLDLDRATWSKFDRRHLHTPPHCVVCLVGPPLRFQMFCKGSALNVADE